MPTAHTLTTRATQENATQQHGHVMLILYLTRETHAMTGYSARILTPARQASARDLQETARTEFPAPMIPATKPLMFA